MRAGASEISKIHSLAILKRTKIERPSPASIAGRSRCRHTCLALQGFGGVLAVVQHELVDRKRWLTKEEFIEEWAVAQIMPGPNVVNLPKA